MPIGAATLTDTGVIVTPNPLDFLLKRGLAEARTAAERHNKGRAQLIRDAKTRSYERYIDAAAERARRGATQVRPTGFVCQGCGARWTRSCVSRAGISAADAASSVLVLVSARINEWWHAAVSSSGLVLRCPRGRTASGLSVFVTWDRSGGTVPWSVDLRRGGRNLALPQCWIRPEYRLHRELTTMRLTLTRSVILTAGLFLAAAPAVAHAQDSVGGGSLHANGSFVQSGSVEYLWDAARFNRTFTEEEIAQCWEDTGGIDLGVPSCPLRPITEMDLAVARLLSGSGSIMVG